MLIMCCGLQVNGKMLNRSFKRLQIIIHLETLAQNLRQYSENYWDKRPLRLFVIILCGLIKKIEKCMSPYVVF
jgi:hypothetical protein